MKIEHGTYTEAHLTAADVYYKPITGSNPADGETFSKIYTNDVSGTVIFTLSDGTPITLEVHPGTMIPLVTKKASVANLIVLR